MKIELDTLKEITVEIGDAEYAVGKKTVEKCRALDKIAKDAEKNSHGLLTPDKMLEAIEIILGKEAKNELFPEKAENDCDKILLIYYGVLDAFNYNTNEINRQRGDEEMEPYMEKLNELSEKIAPLANLNREQRRAALK